MKAYEFLAQLTPEGKLEVDEGFLPSLSVKQTVRVILLIDEPADNAEKMPGFNWLQKIFSPVIVRLMLSMKTCNLC